MGVASDERRELSALFEKLGPDAPTLCDGWQTRDLAAHLVIREHRIDAAPGIMIPALAPHTQRVQDEYAKRPWGELVDLVRSGPNWYWPTSFGKLDELTNTAEFLVHHEDVLRAQPGWTARPADAVRDAAAWKSIAQGGRLNFRKSPVGVLMRSLDGQEMAVKRGPDPVTVVGAPMDLLLFTFGREAVNVTFEGSESAVAALQGSSRGV